MSDEQWWTVSPGYAFGQLERALRASTGDSARVDRWRAVLAGMADGSLRLGSRTPVADTPVWVTLEVAHGGFATGRFLAETPLRDDEVAVLDGLSASAPGTTPRERLNLWYLSDAGQARLLAALAAGTYRIDLPEDAALMVVAWLLADQRYSDALDLVAVLRPLMHRLRMTPRLAASPQGAAVHLASVGDLRTTLRSVRTRRELGVMREWLRVWHPLYDRLVALWCGTVDGDLPHLSDGGVAGGWPCRTWPADWAERRARWLADHDAAAAEHTLARRHPKGNFARLHAFLLACERDSTALSARDVGWVRRAIANTVTKHGAPGTEPRAALRATQLAVAARPTHAGLAAVLAGRLDRYPGDGGLPSVDPVVADVDGHRVPPRLVAKVTRALEAPVDELVARGVITSGDVLAVVLPQITASLLAADFADADLAALYARTYAAFRRRRGLLLLHLEHQVRFEELPWTGALEPLRARRPDGARAARHALAQTTVLALSSFPQAILPNPLVRELGALAKQADVPMPLVEEIAADIFMGTFTVKWRNAAEIAGRVLAGTLYARYYDLPREWRPGHTRTRWGKRTAEDFAGLCVTRAHEARTGGGSRGVAANGTVLEQSQILTTHNLAVLVDGLGLHDRIAALAPDLADRALAWVVHRLSMPQADRHAALVAVKNSAYAWRQALFFLSFADRGVQEEAVARLRTRAAGLTRLTPAVDGLAHVVAGGRFGADGTATDGAGRRFLGWTTGAHWALPARLPERAAWW